MNSTEKHEKLFVHYLQAIIKFSQEVAHTEVWIKFLLRLSLFHISLLLTVNRIINQLSCHNYTHLLIIWVTSLPNWVVIKCIFIVSFCDTIVHNRIAKTFSGFSKNKSHWSYIYMEFTINNIYFIIMCMLYIFYINKICNKHMHTCSHIFPRDLVIKHSPAYHCI